jgi:hypothetical protein
VVRIFKIWSDRIKTVENSVYISVLSVVHYQSVIHISEVPVYAVTNQNVVQNRELNILYVYS